MKTKILLTLFFLLSLCLILFTGDMGHTELLHHAWKKLAGETSQWTPLLDERLPRALVLSCTGAALAVAGAVMQSLFQNPLASPGYLGVSSGGSLLVFLVFIFGWQENLTLLIPLAAVLGSFGTLLLVWRLSKTNGVVELYHLILTGIAISTLLIAVQNALLYTYRHDWHLLQVMTEWQAGSTFNRNWTHVHLQLPLTLTGLWCCFAYRKEMNILSLGEEEAKNIGVDVATVRWRLFLSVALLTGGALAGIGIVAFFGLILPHIIRSFFGPNHRKLIPLSALLGATVLMLLDFLVRALGLHFLTIGNVTAILGGVFFFALLYQARRRGSWLRRSYS